MKGGTYIYNYIHACMRACAHTHIYMYTFTSICMCTYIHACMHIYVHRYIDTCMHAYIYPAIPMHTCTHTSIDTCMHTYIHACIHILPFPRLSLEGHTKAIPGIVVSRPWLQPFTVLSVQGVWLNAETPFLPQPTRAPDTCRPKWYSIAKSPQFPPVSTTIMGLVF